MHWTKLVVEENLSLREAMQVIDSMGTQIVFVVDLSGRLCGSLSDGDLRRALLKGASLNDEVGKYMNSNPYQVDESVPLSALQESMKRLAISYVPITKNQKILRIHTHSESREFNNEQISVLIMAGGRGLRLGEFTKTTPKPLIQIGGKPLIQILIERFASHGFKNIWVSVHYLGSQISDYLGDGSELGVQINYLVEDSPLGTAGSYLMLPEYVRGDSVIVCNADLLTSVDFAELVRFHKENQSVCTMAVIEHQYQIPFGVATIEDNKLISIQEKPLVRNFVSAGFGVFESSAFQGFHFGERIDATEIYKELLLRGASVSTFCVSGYWRDLGTKESLEDASKELGLINDF
jgi:dTDP-glucose pyrophosphorylase